MPLVTITARCTRALVLGMLVALLAGAVAPLPWHAGTLTGGPVAMAKAKAKAGQHRAHRTHNNRKAHKGRKDHKASERQTDVAAAACINPTVICSIPTSPPPPPSQPDLIVSAIQVTDGGARVTIRNAGGKASGAFSVKATTDQYMLIGSEEVPLQESIFQGGQTINCCDEVVSVSSAGIAAGATQTFTMPFRWGCEAYKRVIKVTADAANQVAEASETNNTRQAIQNC
jgi:hypothetical protein